MLGSQLNVLVSSSAVCWHAVDAGVIQAVSGSCDFKHPAQQLETTYITQLCINPVTLLMAVGGAKTAASGVSNTLHHDQ